MATKQPSENVPKCLGILVSSTTFGAKNRNDEGHRVVFFSHSSANLMVVVHFFHVRNGKRPDMDSIPRKERWKMGECVRYRGVSHTCTYVQARSNYKACRVKSVAPPQKTM